jgi:prolyl oligopeptidase
MPVMEGKNWIFSRNDGLQNQAILYKSKTLRGKGDVLLDPNALSADGTVALTGKSFSWNGRYMAYAVSKAGSDWQEWRVRDVETGKDLDDKIEWAKFTSPSWNKKGTGFYYSRYEAPKPGEDLSGINRNQKLYFHALGTPQADDALVYERPDHPDWSFGGGVSEDGRWLLIYQHEGTERKNRIFARDLKDPKGTVKPWFDGFDASYSVMDIKGDKVVVLTDKDAPRSRLVEIDLKDPRPENWKELIPQGRGVLEDVTKVGQRWVAVWSTDAHQTISVYGADGAPQREVALPTLGSVEGLVRTDKRRRGFFTFSSYTHPRTVFRVNFETGATRAFKRPAVKFDHKAFEVTQVFYPSKDGTKIPMFVVHKKGLKLDGSNPTYLYGYGGFNISLTPGFSPSEIAWMEMGGVYAVANLRGGGEYGAEWHDAGRLNNKQNVFDDFIAAAEYLIAQGYTSKKKIAVGGGSNGGLLVGAVMTQRPDLFAAAVPEVGVLDMLRFHLFTIGKGWRSDYGSSETKEGFDTLIKYSPYHNVKDGTAYPPTMVMTGDHDDRVVPAHSFKFAAALQHAQSGDAPILARIESDAGHGAGKPMGKVLDEAADLWAFLVKTLGVTGTPPAPAVPAVALASPAQAQRLASIIAAAKATPTGRRIMKQAEALAAREGSVPLDFQPLNGDLGEFRYMERRMVLDRAMLHKDPRVAAATLLHELQHVIQHGQGLPAEALELELEAHAITLEYLAEAGLAHDGSFSRAAQKALEQGPLEYYAFLATQLPGKFFLRSAPPAEIAETLEDELDHLNERVERLQAGLDKHPNDGRLTIRLAKAKQLASWTARDLELVRDPASLAKYRAFARRVARRVKRLSERLAGAAR